MNTWKDRFFAKESVGAIGFEIRALDFMHFSVLETKVALRKGIWREVNSGTATPQKKKCPAGRESWCVLVFRGGMK